MQGKSIAIICGAHILLFPPSQRKERIGTKAIWLWIQLQMNPNDFVSGNGWPEAGVINILSTDKNNSDKKMKRRVLSHFHFFKITPTNNLDVMPCWKIGHLWLWPQTAQTFSQKTIEVCYIITSFKRPHTLHDERFKRRMQHLGYQSLLERYVIKKNISSRADFCEGQDRGVGGSHFSACQLGAVGGGGISWHLGGAIFVPQSSLGQAIPQNTYIYRKPTLQAIWPG